MNIQKAAIILLIFLSNTLFGQQSLNNYKYIIVQKEYDFLKFENQYQLNSLAKFLFKKEGFTVLFDTDTKPQDLVMKPCLGLNSKVKSNSGLFSTKLQVELKNCRNDVVFISKEGKSKQKDYKKAYHEALRNAFQSISEQDYKYVPTPEVSVTIEKSIETEPDTIEKSLKDNQSQAINEFEKKSKVAIKRPKEIPDSIEDVAPTSLDKNKLPKIPPTPVLKQKESIGVVVDSDILYAQANALGYQLVDSTPKVVYVLLKSGRENIYFLRNKKGILYLDNGQWIVEYYDLDKLIRKSLTIKF